MKKKKQSLPPPFVSESKDHRFAGTFEVFVPLPQRNKPHRVAQNFATKEEAESWMHSPDGKDKIAEALEGVER
jgi:hypothetical protein